MSNNGPPTTPGGPLSFKTVPGRHRTQKWNTAPKNTYDGDDWGGYDPYDEYGGDYGDPEPPLPTQASALPAQNLRKHSFDRGDDGARSVSAPFPTHQAAVMAGPVEGGKNDFPPSRSRPRDFTNPDQAPAPLNASREAVPAPPGFFPPRKTSMGANTFEAQQQAAEARAIAESVLANVGAASASANSPPIDGPLPFIRPSDIYKRMDEEKRRESEDSGRPSVDALERVTSAEQKRNDLQPVQEQAESVQNQSSGPKEVQPEHSSSSPRDKSPTLPLVSRFSGFGDDILSFGGSTSTARSSKPSPPGLDTAGLGTASSSIQPTPTTSHPSSSSARADPAAEQRGDDGLQHTPSVGFRSAVHQAFDQNDASLSRDNSGSTPSTGVGRSDTSSTAGISPIMSRVPSAATAAFSQRQRDGNTPTIAEESMTTPTASRPGSEPLERVGQKSPADGSTSGERVPGTFEPGYRRSLDPPSSGTSPARTPAVGTVESRRLSTPLSGVIGADDTDVADPGEVVKPDLHPGETLASDQTTSAIPITGRGRSNTDYSMREADLANTINSSPEKDPSSPELAEAARESKDSRDLFLRTHEMPSATSPVNTGTPSRADSPAKGRVREIADRYQEIHDTRRGSNASISSSKSGWSTFTDDAKPKPKRAGTGQSGLGQSVPTARPEIGREESFKPDLPGGWINSEAPTPAIENPPPAAARAIPSLDEPIDLTPTTQKHQLQGSSSKSPIDATKEVGDQLGAAFMSQYGVGHQTRDFASKEAPAPVDQSRAMPKRVHGEAPPAPPLLRQETESTDAPTSVSSSAAPTPLPKDTPQPAAGNDTLGAEYFNTVAPLRVRSREPSPEHSEPRQPSNSQPLRRTSSDSADDDRIREEIVRSLDSSAENDARPQDALNAPDNERRVDHGESALPAATMATAAGAGAATAVAASTATPEADATRPGLLNTRFSWEVSEPPRQEPKSPEIKPEAAYERPRSKQLHIMNPGETPISPVSPIIEQKLPEPSGTIGGPLSVPDVQRPEAAAAEGEIVRSLSQRVKGPAAPVAKTYNKLDIPQTTAESGQSTTEGQPTPVSDRSLRVPSYHADSTQDNVHASTSTASPPQQSSAQFHGQVPAFRNILQIKDADERIKAYNSTRQTFADMNTGLGDWLQSMTARHPDVQQTAEQGKPPPLEPSISSSNTNQWKRGHRAAAPSMNLSNLKNRFASGGQAEGSGRTASTGGAPAGLSTGDNAGGSGGVDLDRVQQKGKEFMKNAGVFGSKAGAGAKGLLAKGRSRFGGSVRGKEDSTPPPAGARPPSSRASSSVLAKLRSVSSPASPSRSRHAAPNSNEDRSVPAADATAASTTELSNDFAFPIMQDNGPKAPTSADEWPSSTGARAHAALDQDAQTAFADGVEHGRETVESQTRPLEVRAVLAADPDSVLQGNAPARDLTSHGVAAFKTEDDRAKAESEASASHTTTIAALAEQISEVETRSDAVKELNDAGPVLGDVTTASPAPILGPTTLTSSTHVPSAGLPTASESPILGHKHTPSSDAIDLASALTMAPNMPNRSSTMGPFVATSEDMGRGHTADPSAICPLSTPNLPSTVDDSPSATAARPDARRTSTTGILALRNNARRGGSATPTDGSSSGRDLSRGWTQGAASANSRPLSGVFERLKERTARSWSRSRSRPQSLVFWKGGVDGTSSSVDDNGVEREEVESTPRGSNFTSETTNVSAARPQSALMDFSDVAVNPMRSGAPGSSGSLPHHGSLPGSPQRVEAWNVPGAQIPSPKTPDAKLPLSHQSQQERLGVLPSPAPTAATFADAEHMRRGSDIEVERQRRKRGSGGNNNNNNHSALGSLGEGNWKRGLEERYAADSSLMMTMRTDGEGSPFPTANALTGEPLETVPSQEEEIESPKLGGSTSASARSSPTKRPMQYQRKVSDISTLPSQLHRRAASEGVSSTGQTGLAGTTPAGSEARSRTGSTAACLTTVTTNEGLNVSPLLSGSMNDSQSSGLSDADIVTASPVTMRAIEPVIVPGKEEEATPTAKRSGRVGSDGSSRWDREIAEHGEEIRRLERMRSADGSRDIALETSPRERPAGGAFASIIASATARKEKLQKPQLVEAQHNPYVLPSDQNRQAASARPTSEGRDDVVDKWEDARSEVSAEEGASDDRRSSVSSIGEGENVRPTASRTNTGPPAAGAETSTGESPSTGERTDPSSFETVRAAPHGSHQPPPPLVIEEAMTSRAVPAGLTTNTTSPTSPSSAGLMPGVRQPSLGSSDFHQRFSQRLYAQRPDMGERPMSYMTLPRDEGGYVQEEIDTRNPAAGSTKSLDAAPTAPTTVNDNARKMRGEGETSPLITEDLSALSGPPAGTPPFQQHPVFRQADADYFHDASQQSVMSPSARIPGRDAISDDHGLEDVHAWGDNVVTTPKGEFPPLGNVSTQQPQHSKKKSATWKAAFRGNKPLASLENSDNTNAGFTAGGDDIDRMDTVRKVSGGGKRTLQKPQRASSSAVKLSSSNAWNDMPKEKEKKKRFSGLKSLLGRSSTSAGGGTEAEITAAEGRPGHVRHESKRERSRTRDDKGRKLTKAAPPIAAPGPTALQSTWQPGNSATVKGGVGSYAEYEHARQREMAAFAEQSERSQRILARREQMMLANTGAEGHQSRDERMSPTNVAGAAPASSPPADGWYGPRARERHVDATDVEDYRMPEFRRTDRQQVAPEQRLAADQTASPLPLRDYPASSPPSSVEQRSPPGTRDERLGSVGTAVSGRSEFLATRQRPFGSVISTVSPIQQRPFGSMSSSTISPMHGSPPPLQIQTQGHFEPYQQENVSPRGRVVSMGTAIARSPAKEYQDQQTPFAITLPGAGGAGVVHASDAAWNDTQARVAYDGQQQYQYAEPDDARLQYQQPRSPLYSAGGEGRYPSGQRPHNGFNYEGRDAYGQQQGHDQHGRRGPPQQPTSPPYDNRHHATQPPPQRNWMSQQVFQQGQQYSHPAQAPMYQARTGAANQSGWFPRHQQQQLQYHENEQQRRRTTSIEHQRRRYYAQNAPADVPHSAPQADPQQQQQKPNFSHPPLSAAMQQQQQQRQFMRGEEGGVDHYSGGRRRRAGSGYRGRRDDPAVSEDEVDMMMRGASYPGMEWDPYSGRR